MLRRRFLRSAAGAVLGLPMLSALASCEPSPVEHRHCLYPKVQTFNNGGGCYADPRCLCESGERGQVRYVEVCAVDNIKCNEFWVMGSAADALRG